MGINLRIKHFNLQSQIHVRFPILENQIGTVFAKKRETKIFLM
jgi:hypothetical protein